MAAPAAPLYSVSPQTRYDYGTDSDDERNDSKQAPLLSIPIVASPSTAASPLKKSSKPGTPSGTFTLVKKKLDLEPSTKTPKQQTDSELLRVARFVTPLKLVYKAFKAANEPVSKAAAELRSQINSLQPANVPPLKLKLKHMTKLPEELKGWKIKELDLSGNNGISLPEWLKDSGLTVLKIADCSLFELPKVICSIKTLQILNIANNLLSSLPNEFRDLTNLTHFNFDKNVFQYFPEEAALPSLQQVSCDDNFISEYPNSINALVAKGLSIRNNQENEMNPDDRLYTPTAIIHDGFMEVPVSPPFSPLPPASSSSTAFFNPNRPPSLSSSSAAALPPTRSTSRILPPTLTRSTLPLESFQSMPTFDVPYSSEPPREPIFNVPYSEPPPIFQQQQTIVIRRTTPGSSPSTAVPPKPIAELNQNNQNSNEQSKPAKKPCDMHLLAATVISLAVVILFTAASTKIYKG